MSALSTSLSSLQLNVGGAAAASCTLPSPRQQPCPDVLTLHCGDHLASYRPQHQPPPAMLTLWWLLHTLLYLAASNHSLFVWATVHTSAFSTTCMQYYTLAHPPTTSSSQFHLAACVLCHSSHLPAFWSARRSSKTCNFLLVSLMTLLVGSQQEVMKRSLLNNQWSLLNASNKDYIWPSEKKSFVGAKHEY